MNRDFDTATVGEIVTSDFRAAAVFERFSIDFCCGGKRSLADACVTAQADRVAVLDALRVATSDAAAPGDADAARWSVDRLIDHIVDTHHAYVRASLPRIAQHLEKLVSAHGERHPELTGVAAAFAEVAAELAQHMMKEEQILFPYVRDLAEHAALRPCGGLVSPFGTIENPIRMMEREHRDAGDGLQSIRTLTRGYTTPDDGCRTYRVTMEELAEFERDLHRHIHLENNILFPEAIALERRFA
ncbi:MAG TPA: iron-sulfur cluster repair di-iron protein [Vicinamibacterales bacterium]|nr:iron-sulfur cluster repair di-iron protein [Vicinamibacterales bacterium]